MSELETSRRDALKTAGIGTLSASAFAVLAGAPASSAMAMGTATSADVATLNVFPVSVHETD